MADSGLEHPNEPVIAPPPAKVESLAQEVYALITGGDPNTGFIVGERGVVVVDARATPALAHETLDAIRNITDKPIRYLVLTHYHAVRVLGASGIGAEHIIAHRGTRYLINERGQQILSQRLVVSRASSSTSNLFPVSRIPIFATIA